MWLIAVTSHWLIYAEREVLLDQLSDSLMVDS
jgi:hypothetical protein